MGRLFLIFPILGLLSSLCGPSVSEAQETLDIKELVLAVRRGIAEEQAEAERKNLAPLFLIKEFELEISFVVENKAGGGIKLGVLSIDGGHRREQTHVLRLQKEVLAYEYVKDSVNKCLGKGTAYIHCVRAAFEKAKIPKSWK